MAHTAVNIDHSGYIMQSEVAKIADTTATAWTPVGIVLICATDHVPCVLASAFSQRAICPVA